MLSLFDIILQKMIVEPDIPESFVVLVKTIIKSELEVDRAKARINSQNAVQLFKNMDSLHCGQIFVEDFYSYLKRKGFSLTKKEVKFLNKYFGFSSFQKFNLEIFTKRFLTVLNPMNISEQKQEDSEEAMLEMIKLAIKSYQKIEQKRLQIVDAIEEIHEYLHKFYPENPLSISKTLLKEVLSCLNMYSRLNSALLCNYIIGQIPNEVSLKQIFWKEGQTTASKQISPRQNQIISKKLDNFFKYKPEKKCGGTDILSQIENIEAAYKFKKEQFGEKSKMVPEPRALKQGNFLHPLFEIHRNKESLEKQKERGINEIRNSHLSQSQKKRFYSKDIDQILKRSLKEEKSDFSEQNEIKLEKLPRQRIASHCREDVLSKASSCAKLKIQQIERKVFSKHRLNTRPSEASLTPSHSISINKQVRSKFASIKRK